jgi:hypothetical protein
LREICAGLACCIGKLRHLPGKKRHPADRAYLMTISIAPGKSTVTFFTRRWM